MQSIAMSQTGPSASFSGTRAAWVVAGFTSLGLGILGIFLPLLPTTPLVILAAFCFGKGSPRLHAWMLSHRRFGPMISDWEETGAIPRKVKRFSCLFMAATFCVSAAMGLPWHLLAMQAGLMGIGAAYILTRPDR